MKYLILSLFILFGCNYQNDKAKKESFNSNYFSPTSEWGTFQKFIPEEVRKKIQENLADTSKEFIAQLYESSENFAPQIDKLITIRFNIQDSLLNYDYQTSTIHVNKKSFTPNKQQRIYWSNVFFNPIDTVFSRLNSCDFWNQPSEIKVDGDDGRYFCIIVKYKGRIKYVLRWSPDVVKGSVYPHRKEYMNLCDLFKNLGKLGFYDNFWNMYGLKIVL